MSDRGLQQDATSAAVERKTIVICGRTYHVDTNVSDGLLVELVRDVEGRARKLCGGKCVTIDGLVLASLTLAAESREQAVRADQMAQFARDSLVELLRMVDAALAHVPDTSDVSTAVVAVDGESG